MTRRSVVALSLSALAAVAAERREREKRPKVMELEVVAVSAHRAAEGIELDGRIRNRGVRPLEGLALVFSFYADEKKPLTTQSAAIDEAVLEPGQESTFRFAMRDVPRAVSFTLQARDGAQRDVGVSREGPFTLE